MAGMEQLEIHSKSYLVRWVDVKSEHTISWSIQPHKKSINFGVFKHPGSGNAPAPKGPSTAYEAPPTPGLKPSEGSLDFLQSHAPSASTAIERLTAIGLKLINWYGTCEANQVTSGKYDVPKNEGGMYALVFDNTFAKSFSKTATFVLLTFPTNSAPSSNHQVHHIQGTASASTTSLKGKSLPKVGTDQFDSSDSIPQTDGSHGISLPLPQGQEKNETNSSSNFYTGILQKRRRKRHQGHARRFFCLDFSTATLSYYHNKNTVALRGAVPLSLAAIGANATTREISIDSGAEVWHLRAPNQKEFESWKQALETASRGPAASSSPNGLRVDTNHQRIPAPRVNADEDQEWATAEDLVARVATARNIVRSLAKDTDPKYLLPNTSKPNSASNFDPNRIQDVSSSEASPVDYSFNDEDQQANERRPFWKRKASGGRPHLGNFRRSVSAQPVLTSLITPGVPSDRRPSSSIPTSLQTFQEDSVHERCMDLLQNLDLVVADFSALIADSKRRRMPLPALSTSRLSLDSTGEQEFFDAEAGDRSQLLTIQDGSEDDVDATEQGFAIDTLDDSSASEIEDSDSLGRLGHTGNSAIEIFPTKAKSLSPLPMQPIKRRSKVPVATLNPPSLIGFFRKNVGKDLSTVSMPVSANEPISLLQRLAEGMEYSHLLDDASRESMSSVQRLLCVTAFAVSSISALRVKERAIRKPFNPMLGETYELVREDKGFRFIAEKVSHRPVIMACQAESERWSMSQTPLPTQKFWGKSVELITEGRVRVTLHNSGDRFSWTSYTCFLRNIIAGEKYIEPVGTMTVTNETTGDYATVEFKAKGMFSGRSEDVVVKTFDSFGEELPVGLVGKWTQSLSIVENGDTKPKPLWVVGDVVSEAPKCYGFPAFTASLNEITADDKAKIAPTDSRLRLDQRAAEEGDLDAAETVKARLEDGQRERRRRMDEEGSQWQPMWFTRLEGREGEEVWKMRSGKDSYWEHRAKGDWKAVTNVLAV